MPQVAPSTKIRRKSKKNSRNKTATKIEKLKWLVPWHDQDQLPTSNFSFKFSCCCSCSCSLPLTITMERWGATISILFFILLGAFTVVSIGASAVQRSSGIVRPRKMNWFDCLRLSRPNLAYCLQCATILSANFGQQPKITVIQLPPNNNKITKRRRKKKCWWYNRDFDFEKSVGCIVSQFGDPLFNIVIVYGSYCKCTRN